MKNKTLFLTSVGFVLGCSQPNTKEVNLVVDGWNYSANSMAFKFQNPADNIAKLIPIYGCTVGKYTPVQANKLKNNNVTVVADVRLTASDFINYCKIKDESKLSQNN